VSAVYPEVKERTKSGEDFAPHIGVGYFKNLVSSTKDSILIFLERSRGTSEEVSNWLATNRLYSEGDLRHESNK
jgi:hypothetical protein